MVMLYVVIAIFLLGCVWIYHSAIYATLTPKELSLVDNRSLLEWDSTYFSDTHWGPDISKFKQLDKTDQLEFLSAINGWVNAYREVSLEVVDLELYYRFYYDFGRELAQYIADQTNQYRSRNRHAQPSVDTLYRWLCKY